MNLVIVTLISTFSIAMCDVEVLSEYITGYPKHAYIMNTSFSCLDKPDDGFYADIEAKCQSFHMCQGGKFESFLCPTGTTFSQKEQVCDFWYNVDCSSTSEFYNHPASVNVDSLDTVVDYQTIHEDGFVVPPKPLTESESEYVAEDLSEPVPMTIDDLPVIPLLEPPLQDFETSIPVIRPIANIAKPTEIPIIQPIHIATTEAIAKPTEIPIIRPIHIATTEAIAKPTEIPIIRPIHIGTTETAAKPTEIPIIQPIQIATTEANEDTSVGMVENQSVNILTVVNSENTSVDSQDAQPVHPTHISNIESEVTQPELDSNSTKIPEPLVQDVPLKEPNSNEGKIPESVKEDMSTLEDNDKVTFPQNDDNPFFDPIDRQSSDVTYPTVDTIQEKADHYVFTMPPIEFLPHAEIDVAKPLPSMDYLKSSPAVYHGIPQPHISLYDQDVKFIKETPKMQLPGDKIIRKDAKLSLPVPEVVPHSFKVTQPIASNPVPAIEYKQILYNMGHKLRMLQPIINSLPFLYKVPSAIVGDKSTATQ